MKLWLNILGVVLLGAVLLAETPTPEEQWVAIRDITMVAVGAGADITVKTKFVGYQNQTIQLCLMIKNAPSASAPSVAARCADMTPDTPVAVMGRVFSFTGRRLPVGMWYAYAEARLKSSGEVLATKVVAKKTPAKPPKPGTGY